MLAKTEVLATVLRVAEKSVLRRKTSSIPPVYILSHEVPRHFQMLMDVLRDSFHVGRGTHLVCCQSQEAIGFGLRNQDNLYYWVAECIRIQRPCAYLGTERSVSRDLVLDGSRCAGPRNMLLDRESSFLVIANKQRDPSR
jgi:hypothetical protein